MFRKLLQIRGFGKVLWAVVFLNLSLVMGVSGYMIIEDYKFLDSFYMTVITLSTVGFKEVNPLSDPGKLFTGIYIILNLIIFAYVVSVITTYLFEGELKQVLKSYMTERELKRLKNHVIVCGYGRNGSKACEELAKSSERFVVIEAKEDIIEEMPEANRLNLVRGDATQDEVLKRARIDSALALITTLPNDADNVFITLTAKELNPDLNIIARATDDTSEKKLHTAGATHVVMPDFVGGIQMAHLITQPYVIEFLEILSGVGERQNLKLEEIAFYEFRDECRNKTLQELDIRKKTGASVIGFKEKDEGFVFNPQPDTTIEEDDILIVLGDDKNLEKFKTEFL